MTFKKIIYTVSFLLCILLLMPSAYADSTPISKQQAVNTAQQVSPGRILSVKLKGAVYRVKTLNSKGEVRIISIDANTGKVIGR